jgi:DNA-binding LacI/PurR family transcriptional regulator
VGATGTRPSLSEARSGTAARRVSPVGDNGRVSANAETAGRRATIRDVARLAGVSKSLVSLVYSSPESVSPERTQRVLSAAAELGYRPNHIARSLNGVRGDVVGILVADPHNPVLDDVVEAARVALERAGRLGLLTSAVLPGTGPAHLDRDVVSMVADLRPSGLLVVGSVPDMATVVTAVDGARIVIASARAGGARDVASVRGDDDAGMRLVVDHLVGLGHRRIGHIGGEGSPVAVGRVRAFSAAMVEHGLEGDVIESSDFTERAGYRAALALLDRDEPPTAITGLNDLAAIGALTAVRERGLGDRVAVTGYDNTYLAGLGLIGLTSVEPGNAEIGRRAAELLLDPDASPVEILVAPELMVRASSGLAP